MMQTIKKFPRTKHISGSRLQKGDEDLEIVSFDEAIANKNIIVEEKLDGANCGISFDDDYNMLLQSRGHYLTGGPREKHWTLFKQYTSRIELVLLELLERRYIMYGEWLYAKHTEFYDLLPHYFFEFDIFDKQSQQFLSTKARRQMLDVHGKKVITSVPVLFAGKMKTFDQLKALQGQSYFKSGVWKDNLNLACENANVDFNGALKQTSMSQEMEGLYIKVEDDEHVTARYKLVRESFTNAILDSEMHWLDRPIIKNHLAPFVTI